jgi:tetratricopeptide (TPR) repeat protein
MIAHRADMAARPAETKRRTKRRVATGAKTATTGAQQTKASWAPLVPFLLVAVTLIAYQPVWHAGFVWDDDTSITHNSTLHDVDGLRRMWLQPDSLPQYYPLSYTAFWIQYRFWGLSPLGYHVVNVLLHALMAVLFGHLLLRLGVRGAWLAAFVFALHPVAVESVAWITELKNVLSGVLYFAAALAYLRFSDLRDADAENARQWRWYGAALILFIAAVLSKTVVCSLPAALLLVRWWRTGRLKWSDVVPLLPFFVFGAALGLLTAWFERHVVGALGEEFSLTFAERCLVAGRALWFYIAALVWPVNLMFINPRWKVSAAEWWQWLFPIAAVGVVLALWMTRRRTGRAPLAACLFYVGTLGPALGFFNLYFSRYSFVADHFQYLASTGLIALGAAAASARFNSVKNPGPVLGPLLCVGLLLPLGLLTRRQAEMYTDMESLWRGTLAANSHSWMAQTSLGYHLLGQGRTDEALPYLQQGVDLRPSGLTLDNLGSALLQKGRLNEAIAQFQQAVDREPDYLSAHNNLGIALLRAERLDEAVAQFQEVLRIRPDFAAGHNNLGSVLFQKGQLDAAAAHFGTALERSPDYADAADNVARVAWLLATCPEASIRNGARAVELAQRADHTYRGKNAAIARTLAAAFAEASRFSEAVSTARRALGLVSGTDKEELQKQLALYEAQKPYHQLSPCTVQ